MVSFLAKKFRRFFGWVFAQRDLKLFEAPVGTGTLFIDLTTIIVKKIVFNLTIISPYFFHKEYTVNWNKQVD